MSKDIIEKLNNYVAGNSPEYTMIVEACDRIKRLEYLIYWYINEVGMAEGVDFLHSRGEVLDIPEARELVEIYDRIEKHVET